MEPLAVVTRNDYIESVHYGYICVVDPAGNIIHSLGSPDTSIYFRSSAKPIQAIPFIQSGASKAFGFSLRDIALVCASHAGQTIHQQATTLMLEKLDLTSDFLHCGIMQPYNEEENKRLSATGQAPSVLHCSCSGKHTAMLALAKYRGYSMEDYEKLHHPVQREILETMAYFAHEDIHNIPLGVDGCGVPIYLLPIQKIARSYSKLMAHGADEGHPLQIACKTIIDAMTHYHEMVSGDHEFCTELMLATHHKIIGKVGCEAVYCIGIKDKNLGICIKVVDGNERAIYPIVIHTLNQLGVLNEEELSKLRQWYRPQILNNLQEPIGEIIPVFHLEKPRSNASLMGKKISDILKDSFI